MITNVYAVKLKWVEGCVTRVLIWVLYPKVVEEFDIRVEAEA